MGEKMARVPNRRRPDRRVLGGQPRKELIQSDSFLVRRLARPETPATTSASKFDSEWGRQFVAGRACRLHDEGWWEPRDRSTSLHRSSVTWSAEPCRRQSGNSGGIRISLAGLVRRRSVRWESGKVPTPGAAPISVNGGMLSGVVHPRDRCRTPSGNAVKDFSGIRFTRWPTRFRPPLPRD